MRVLITASPVPTHFMPMVPLAWELRNAGHEVIVAVPPDVTEAVRAAGLNAVEVGERVHVKEQIRRRLPEEGRRLIHAHGAPDAEELRFVPPVWLRYVQDGAADYVDFARRFGADLVLSDPLEMASLLVGGALRIPVVHHRWGADPMSLPLRGSMRELLAGTCRELGLARLPDPALLLDPFPAVLQPPEAEPSRAFRPALYNGGGELPGWAWREWPADGSRGSRSTAAGAGRIVVALGTHTLALGGVPLMRTLLDALAGFEAEVFAPVEESYHAAIGPVPDNVRMTGPVPLHLVVPGARAVVHHAGAGTVAVAMAAGVPQLALPQVADQFVCGERLAAAGAGITLGTAAEQDDPECVRAAVARLLEEPRWSAGARRLRAEVERLPGPARIVAELENLAATWRAAPEGHRPLAPA